MTTTYAYLDTAGFVRQWSTAPSPSAVVGLTLHQLPPGETMHEHLRMVDGALLRYEPALQLQDVQDGAIDDANAARDRAIAEFCQFTFDGVLYDGDQRAEARITLAARSAAMGLAPDGLVWRAFDNTDRLLTADQVAALEVALIGAKVRHVAHHHECCRALKAAILAAETPAAVRAVVSAAVQMPVVAVVHA